LYTQRLKARGWWALSSLATVGLMYGCESAPPPPRVIAPPYSTEAPAAVIPLETLATFDSGAMPTGIAVSRSGRIFVSFPRWTDQVTSSIVEIVNGQPTPYPDSETNKFEPADPTHHLLCVQSVTVDDDDRLWALDAAAPNFGTVVPGGAKLVCFELGGNRVEQTIFFPNDVALPHSYLNDVRFDLKHGDKGYAFITDSSDRASNAIIVVDLSSRQSWRALNDDPSVKAEPNYSPVVDGQPLLLRSLGKDPMPMTTGVDGIAISPDGNTAYYCPLSGDHLYQIPTKVLEDPKATDAQRSAAVVDLGSRGFPSDGLAMGVSGKLYLTDYVNHAIHVREPGGWYRLVLAGPCLAWPDSLSLGSNGNLFFTVNQLQNSARFHDGKDLRRPPYFALRIPVQDGAIMRGG
jgi:sugar lactone lactonase YvrE